MIHRRFLFLPSRVLLTDGNFLELYHRVIRRHEGGASRCSELKDIMKGCASDEERHEHIGFQSISISQRFKKSWVEVVEECSVAISESKIISWRRSTNLWPYFPWIIILITLGLGNPICNLTSSMSFAESTANLLRIRSNPSSRLIHSLPVPYINKSR